MFLQTIPVGRYGKPIWMRVSADDSSLVQWFRPFFPALFDALPATMPFVEIFKLFSDDGRRYLMAHYIDHLCGHLWSWFAQRSWSANPMEMEVIFSDNPSDVHRHLTRWYLMHMFSHTFRDEQGLQIHSFCGQLFPSTEFFPYSMNNGNLIYTGRLLEIYKQPPATLLAIEQALPE